jgi:hypothetical protein
VHIPNNIPGKDFVILPKPITFEDLNKLILWTGIYQSYFTVKIEFWHW